MRSSLWCCPKSLCFSPVILFCRLAWFDHRHLNCIFNHKMSLYFELSSMKSSTLFNSSSADNTQLFLSFPSSSSNIHIVMLISECLETSLHGQLLITSNSTSVKLNSSSLGKTALVWTCQSLSRMSRYCHRQLRGTWVYSSRIDCPPLTLP